MLKRPHSDIPIDLINPISLFEKLALEFCLISTIMKLKGQNILSKYKPCQLHAVALLMRSMPIPPMIPEFKDILTREEAESC